MSSKGFLEEVTIKLGLKECKIMNFCKGVESLIQVVRCSVRPLGGTGAWLRLEMMQYQLACL